MWSNSLTIDSHATSAIDPSNFSTTIDNPFLTLKPGTTFVYEDKGAHTVDYVEVTHLTKVVDGVLCVQIHDFEYLNGQLSEDTLDWVAQDSDGNVWYFGELSQQYEPGNPNPVGFEGSWEAGVNGARPGIIMEANPQVGDFYNEEHAAGVARDQAEVTSLDKSVDVTYGAFDHLLKTDNSTPLEPDVLEHKYYAAGIGNVLTTDNEGAFEQLVLIKVDGQAGDDTLNGYAGNDQISGWGGNDTMFGLSGDDLMNGGDGNDYAAGGAKQDVLNGDAGNDTLDGGNGKDVVAGGLGNDILTGGKGADHFTFSESDGTAVDTITDYSQAQGDAIVLNNGGDDVAYDSFVNGSWQLTLNDGHIIVLPGVTDANADGHITDNLTILDAFGAVTHANPNSNNHANSNSHAIAAPAPANVPAAASAAAKAAAVAPAAANAAVVAAANPGQHPDPSEFTTTIDNPYYTLTPGTTFVYKDVGLHNIDYVVVTDETRVVDGVTCVQVHDYNLLDGYLVEDTLDWYAQDSQGNVWYFGELTQQYEPGNPNPIGFEGSFEAGVNGAHAGYIMEANPQVGDSYFEERAIGVAVDQAEVANFHSSANVVYGSFDSLLKTNNTSPTIEPGHVEHKFYSTEIGNVVLETDNEGGVAQLVEIRRDGTAAADTLNGYVGRDTISGAGGDDLLSGLGGRDLMSGGDGNDYAAGGAGEDVLNGDAGNDTLDGGNGKDVVAGGLGNDILTGGKGADHFVFNESNGTAVDTITDYSQAQGDAIVLNGGENDVAYDAFVNGSWQLTLNDGHVIVLSGVADANHDGHILDNVNILGPWGA